MSSAGSWLKTAGSELLGLLVDDWLLFLGTVAALTVAALVAAASTGHKTAAGLVLFVGIWTGLLVSLLRAARLHRAKLMTADRAGGADQA